MSDNFFSYISCHRGSTRTRASYSTNPFVTTSHTTMLSTNVEFLYSTSILIYEKIITIYFKIEVLLPYHFYIENNLFCFSSSFERENFLAFRELELWLLWNQYLVHLILIKSTVYCTKLISDWTTVVRILNFISLRKE